MARPGARVSQLLWFVAIYALSIAALGAAAFLIRSALAVPAPRKGPAVVTVPIIIAHRGASCCRPEHTLAAYEQAIEMGADFVEPDLVMTRDGVLVARHEPYLGGDNADVAGADSTDVASRPAFASRKRTETIDGVRLTGWFACDFTLAELKTLRARERLPQLRPDNAARDGLYEVPTLDEIIALVRRWETRQQREIGIYPETKHPTWHAANGLAMERLLVATLRRAGYEDEPERVFIQSFEVGNLQALAKLTRIPLIQLMGGDEERPADLAASGDMRTYRDLATPAGLKAIAAYAAGVGPAKGRVIAIAADGALGPPTRFVADANAAGLAVHPYTFRSENFFLPPALKRGADPRARGDAEAEYLAFMRAGVDGLFSDWTADALAARKRFAAEEVARLKGQAPASQ